MSGKKDESISLESIIVHDRFIGIHIRWNLGEIVESSQCEQSLAYLFVLEVEVVALVESNVVLDTREHLKELSTVKLRSFLTRIHLVPHVSDLRFYLSELKFRSSESLGRRKSHGHLVELSHHLVDRTLDLLTLDAATRHLVDLLDTQLALDIQLRR